MLSSKQRSFWVLRTLSAVTMLSACNLILDNDPRSLDPGAGGESAVGGHNEAVGGSTSSGRGGTQAESGSPSHERGGEAGAGGEAEAGGRSGAGAPSSGCGAANTSEPGCEPPGTECTPGKTASRSILCGACMTGTQAQTRTCTGAGTWGPWDTSAPCMGVTAACSPGTPETRSVSCPCSGTKTQSRACSATCTWGNWSDTSSCDLTCCSEIVYCDTPDNIAKNRGTWCQKQDADCSSAEVDADCNAIIKDVCGSVVNPLFIEH
ncbi:MAG: hypothetical protein K0R38_593 [Polyangiaceae bacterium]|nr:hypothetical protein [Polyangiaceae bacterium]